MADIHGIKTRDIKSTDRHGTQDYVQASDGTGTNGHLAGYNADGSLTDTTIAVSDVVTLLGTGIGTWIQEVPTGALNGTNKTFTISHTPLAGTLVVWLNGVEQDPNWLSASGAALTFVVAPTSADQMYAEYEY